MSWRFPLAFQVFFACLLCCLLPFLPESPRLLIRKGMHREAMEVLAALEGSEATPSSSSIKAQFEIIKDILDREHLDTYSWGQLLTGKGVHIVSQSTGSYTLISPRTGRIPQTGGSRFVGNGYEFVSRDQCPCVRINFAVRYIKRTRVKTPIMP